MVVVIGIVVIIIVAANVQRCSAATSCSILDRDLVIVVLGGHHNVRFYLDALRHIQIERTRRRRRGRRVALLLMVMMPIQMAVRCAAIRGGAGHHDAAGRHGAGTVVAVAAAADAARRVAASRRLLREILGDAKAAAASDARQSIAFVGRRLVVHFVLVLGHHFPFRKVFVVLLIVEDLAADRVGLLDDVLGWADGAVVVVGRCIIVVVHGQIVVVRHVIIVVVRHDVIVVVCGNVIIVVAEQVQMGGELGHPDDVLAEIGLLPDDRGRRIRVHQCWNVQIGGGGGHVIEVAVEIDGTDAVAVVIRVVIHVTEIGVDLADGLDDGLFAHLRRLRTDHLLEFGCALKKWDMYQNNVYVCESNH